MPGGPTEFSLPVTTRDHGKRLDLFLADRLSPTSRAQIQRHITNGHIRVNGRAAKAGARIREGDLIEAYLPPPEPSDVSPENLPLTILYQDGHIAVIDKAPGIVVHPAGRLRSGTLVNALLFHCRDLQGVGGVLRPGIVHRLDKGTSGVMVIAKNDAAHEDLVTQFKQRLVGKTYSALVYGPMPTGDGVISSPMGRHPTDRKKFSVRSRHPKDALTSWHVKERFSDLTFLEISPKTGRTHQIRVHMHSVGHPVVGDPVYSGRKHLATLSNAAVRAGIVSLGRQALHAHRLTFRHPATGRIITFVSPLPSDMRTLLEIIRDAER